MLSRIRGPRSPARKEETSIHDGVDSLIGASGVSLDGESLMLPEDGVGMRDEVSSINTSNYGESSLPVKSFHVDSTDEPSMLGDDLSALGDPTLEKKAAVAPPPSPKPVPVGSDDESEGGLLPGWVKGASPYFKGIFILSTALLIGAVVLVVVAAVLASNDDDDSSSSSGIADLSFPPTTPTPPITLEPSAAPTTLPTSSPAPTTTPYPTMSPSASPTEFPTATPTTAAPTIPGASAEPSVESSLEPTNAPTAGIREEIIFYVTAGRFQGNSLDQLPERLESLPDDNGRAFIVHLGDWNSPFATGCDEDSYENVDELFSTSSVPVYFVVGDNEWNDCPDTDEAFEFWYEYLLEYETKYFPPPQNWDVVRQEDEGYDENFAFFYNNVLFVGINLVGGQVHDQREWDTRMEANVEWIDDNVDAYNNTQMLVVFAHADPDIASTSPFFADFFDRVRDDYAFPVVFIHRNLGVEESAKEEIDGIDNLSLLIVEGQAWPPMRVKVDTSGAEYDFSFDQRDWYDDEVGGP